MLKNLSVSWSRPEHAKESRFSTALPILSFKPDESWPVIQINNLRIPWKRRPSAVEHMMLTTPTTGDNDEAYGAAWKFSILLSQYSHGQWATYQSRRSRSCIVNNGKLHGRIHHLKSNSVIKNPLQISLPLALCQRFGHSVQEVQREPYLKSSTMTSLICTISSLLSMTLYIVDKASVSQFWLRWP